MHEYEVYIEDINPCGGSQYAKKEFLEVEAESPEAYVKENGRFPIWEVSQNSDGDTVITTGDGQGNFIKYTFSEEKSKRPAKKQGAHFIPFQWRQ